MRHPFDGIIIPETGLNSTGPTRRSILSYLAASVPALLGLFVVSARGNPPDGQTSGDADADEKKEKKPGYKFFFVVPKNVRKFDTARRTELNVQGDFIHGWRSRPDLRSKQGFGAWITDQQAEALRRASDVEGVHEIGAKDVVITGRPTGVGELIVPLSPNRWRNKPEADAYQSGKELAKQWSDRFARTEGLIIRADKLGNRIYVRAKDGRIPSQVVQALKAHPQVTSLQFAPMMTTMALGEEGNRPGATTRAVGEEGDRPRPRPTTLAVGEEGGPRPTTLAVGEEGGRRPGRITTHALGEEGSRPRAQ